MMGMQKYEWCYKWKKLLKPIGGTGEEQHERWKLQYKAVESITWYCPFKTNCNRLSRQCYTLSSEWS